MFTRSNAVYVETFSSSRRKGSSGCGEGCWVLTRGCVCVCGLVEVIVGRGSMRAKSLYDYLYPQLFTHLCDAPSVLPIIIGSRDSRGEKDLVLHTYT